MDTCHACSGSCGGCARELVLTPEEAALLASLGQLPFQPVARRAADPAPVYLGEGEREASSAAAALLEKKGLISLDYDRPLKNFHSAEYDAFPIRGSMALTARGQQVLDLLEIQGAE